MTFQRLTLHSIARAAAACALGCGATLALAQQPTTTTPPSAMAPATNGTPATAAAAPTAPDAATAQGTTAAPGAMTAPPATTAPNHARNASDEAASAHSQVEDTVAMVKNMEADPQLKTLMQQAKGIFFIPDYGRASFIVGGQGGAGVLVVKHNGEWSGPGFYNFGGASIGAQAGVAGGEMAMLLMNDKAVQSFANHDKFSLNADAGLTVVDYSTRAHGATSHGDVIVWSDTKGLHGNLSVSVTDVNYDGDETHAYYGEPVTAQQIVAGKADSAKAEALMEALPA